VSGEIQCPACKHTAQPVFGLWDSGQFGPQCARCQTVLGAAATPAMGAAMVRDDKYRPTAAPVAVASDLAPPMPARTERAPSKPVPRATATSRPALPDGADDLQILCARLEDISAESARIRIEVCRLRGLEVEEKHLRREIARIEDQRMKDRVRSAQSAQPELPHVNGVAVDIRN
jgi:hypothetical protein